MTLRAPLIVLLCATAALAAVKAQVRLPPPAPRAIVIIGGTLVDGSSAAPVHNDGILVQNGRIARMGIDATRRAPKDVRTLDATGKWVLPGLIDGHVHLFQTGGLDARPDFVPDPLGRPHPDIAGKGWNAGGPVRAGCRPDRRHQQHQAHRRGDPW